MCYSYVYPHNATSGKVGKVAYFPY